MHLNMFKWLQVQGKKLFTARCLLAYSSPVFDKNLASAKKPEVDMNNRELDDVIQLVCYLDPRVQYKITGTRLRF